MIKNNYTTPSKSREQLEKERIRFNRSLMFNTLFMGFFLMGYVIGAFILTGGI